MSDANRWDEGLQEDFNNMTEELGRELSVYPRSNDLDYGGQEGTSSGLGTPTTEIVIIQEIDATHEVVQSGMLSIGDVRFTFRHNSIAEEEGYVYDGDNQYKILQLTKVKNMHNNNILYIKAFGKKIPKR